MVQVYIDPVKEIYKEWVRFILVQSRRSIKYVQVFIDPVKSRNSGTISF